LIPLGSCKYNLKIFWTKRAGLFTKVLEALYSNNVQVLSLNTITFYGYAESFFSIEVKLPSQLCLQQKMRDPTELLNLFLLLVF
jgi:ACT domain-containing protein